MNNFLEIKNLSKTYYTIDGEIEAIKNINLNIKEGEIIAIVGSSGCGKSTLLSILAFLEQDYKGKIKYQIDNPTIGYMLQEDALFPWLNILDNCCLGLDILKIKTKINIDKVKKLLDSYGLTEFINKYPNCLSGGMKQRVALIRTLAINPDILLLDEPFSALDYQTRLAISDDVFKILKSLNKTTLIITHDIAEAISIADRIIVLSKRPATIKSIYEINLTDKSTPIENRKAKEFSNYYAQIWKDLDIHVT